MTLKKMKYSLPLLMAALLSPWLHAENTVSFQATKYQESDNLIGVKMAEVAIEKDFGTDYTLKLDFGYDAISGASPMWVPKPGYVNEWQLGTVKVADEVRNSQSGSLAIRDEARNEYTIGLARSVEPDFESYALSLQGMLYQDESHNRSYTVGASWMANTAVATAYTNNHTDEDSTVLAFQAGVNQVLDATSTLDASVYMGRDSGYLTNHYLKVVRTDALGQHFLAPEERPDLRVSGGAALRWIKNWNSTFTSNTWYRFYRDDWGVQSHTVELKVYADLNEQWRVLSSVRGYHQTAANFQRNYDDIVNTFAATGPAANDSRLGRFHAETYQLGLQYKASADWSFNLSGSQYRQSNGFSAYWLTSGMSYRY
jgi:hypothetical protein